MSLHSGFLIRKSFTRARMTSFFCQQNHSVFLCHMRTGFSIRKEFYQSPEDFFIWRIDTCTSEASNRDDGLTYASQVKVNEKYKIEIYVVKWSYLRRKSFLLKKSHKIVFEMCSRSGVSDHKNRLAKSVTLCTDLVTLLPNILLTEKGSHAGSGKTFSDQKATVQRHKKTLFFAQIGGFYSALQKLVQNLMQT